MPTLPKIPGTYYGSKAEFTNSGISPNLLIVIMLEDNDTLGYASGSTFYMPADSDALKKGDVKIGVSTPGLPTLCSDCHEAAYGYEPDMGDDDFTFADGMCSNPHTPAYLGTVWSMIP